MFKQLKEAVRSNLQTLLQTGKLFYVTIDRDRIWELYLDGFAEEERQEHNCNSCKSFLRQWAGIVAFDIDGNVLTLWDNIDANEFNNSAESIRQYILSLPITDVFLTESTSCGTDRNKDSKNDTVWEHFHITVPREYVNTRNPDAVKGDARTRKQTLKRALDEITKDAVETTLELIAQGSLYRGKEFEPNLQAFLLLQKQYAKFKGNKDNFCWMAIGTVSPALAGIRNTAIGTLLVNLSEGMELDTAVSKFEQVVAPSNYKRPTALVTPKMVQQAKDKLGELGLLDSIERRYARESDLNVSDILFVDRRSAVSDVFGQLAADTLVNPKSLSKTEEMPISEFLEKVVPTSKSIDLLLENRHLSNMLSLITAVNPTAPSLFKWNNPFSWSYTGGMTDSLKDKVAKLGGRVDGVFRFTHSWNEIEPNQSLMDLHVFMPGNEHTETKVCDQYGRGRRIGWNNRTDPQSGGNQDVDYVNAAPAGHVPVENITFPSISKMPEGKYICKIHNWAFRGTGGRGRAEIEVGGNIYQYEYPRTKNKEWVTVAEVTLKNGEFTVKHILPENTMSKDKWGVKTNQWLPVSRIMLSPNHWENPIGNKHFMFFLEGCVSDESPRPFYNEFLKGELDVHRKVFETLAGKIKVEDDEHQLSGIGFSETQSNSIIARVEGKFKRNIKIIF